MSAADKMDEMLGFLFGQDEPPSDFTKDPKEIKRIITNLYETKNRVFSVDVTGFSLREFLADVPVRRRSPKRRASRKASVQPFKERLKLQGHFGTTPFRKTSRRESQRSLSHSQLQRAGAINTAQAMEGTMFDLVVLNEGNLGPPVERLRELLSLGIEANEQVRRTFQPLLDYVEDIDDKENEGKLVANLKSRLFTTRGEVYVQEFDMRLTPLTCKPTVFGMQKPPVRRNAQREYDQITVDLGGTDPCIALFSYLMYVAGIEQQITFERNNSDVISYKWGVLKALRTDLHGNEAIQTHVIPVIDFNAFTLRDALKILQLTLGDTRTVIHCGAGFGRTGAAMWLLHYYSKCVETRGEIYQKPPPTTRDEFDEFADLLDEQYPHKNMNPGNPDSASMEMINRIWSGFAETKKVRGRCFAQRYNSIVLAGALTYLKYHDPTGVLMVQFYDLDAFEASFFSPAILIQREIFLPDEVEDGLLTEAMISREIRPAAAEGGRRKKTKRKTT